MVTSFYNFQEFYTHLGVIFLYTNRLSVGNVINNLLCRQPSLSQGAFPCIRFKLGRHASPGQISLFFFLNSALMQ